MPKSRRYPGRVSQEQAPEVDDRHPLRVLLGGPWGAIESMAPTVLFVLAYFASGNSLAIAVGVALGVALILAAVKLVRREKPDRVLSGLLGVAVAALFAAYQDDPMGFSEIRVLANILSALAFAGSIVIKRPLMGVIIGPLMGTGMRWPTVLFVGWFGPRGLVSVVFALIAVESLVVDEPLRAALLTVSLTVALSVLAHGISATPLAQRYGRWVANAPTGAETRPDRTEEPEFQPRPRGSILRTGSGHA